MTNAKKYKEDVSEAERSNVIQLFVHYSAVKMEDAEKKGKCSWAVIDRRTGKPYDKWTTQNLEEHAARSMARRMNLNATLRINDE